MVSGHKCASGLRGFGSPGILEKDGGNNLKAVGDAVPNLAKQDVQSLDNFIFCAFTGASIGDVCNGNKEAWLAKVFISEEPCVNAQTARLDFWPGKFGLQGGLRRAVCNRSEKGAKLWKVPFSRTQPKQRLAHGCRRINPESLAERLARSCDTQFAIKQ